MLPCRDGYHLGLFGIHYLYVLIHGVGTTGEEGMGGGTVAAVVHHTAMSCLSVGVVGCDRGVV